MIFYRFVVFIILLHPLINYAENQSLDVLRHKIESFVKEELPNQHHDQINIVADNIDPRLHLQKCQKKQLEAFNPYQHLTKQHTTIGIRCKEPTNHWTIYVPVRITILKEVLVSSHPLSKGDIITNRDVHLQKQNVSFISQDYMDDSEQALGLVVKKNIKEGQPIPHSLLQKPWLVKKGEQILIQAISGNIKITMAAVALADGALNETIKVRNLTSKRVVDAQVVDVRKVTVLSS